MSLSLGSHGIYGLIRPNGAGKTMVFNVVTGALENAQVGIACGRRRGAGPARAGTPASGARDETAACLDVVGLVHKAWRTAEEQRREGPRHA